MKLTKEQIREILDKIENGLNMLSSEIRHASFDELTGGTAITVECNLPEEYDDELISIQVILP